MSAELEADRIRILRGRERTEIPLAAIQEARVGGERVVEVVLTDGVTHRVEGGNPTATAAFVAAVNDGLPDEREADGSTLVRTEATPADPALRWIGLLLAAVALGYIGFVIWAGAAHGVGGVVLALIAGVCALIGLLNLITAAIATFDRVVLARRGITVRAVRNAGTNVTREGALYTYTGADGSAYSRRFKRKTAGIHVVYDPEDLFRVRETFALFEVILRLVARYVGALCCLAFARVAFYSIF
ncbi:hypothetical protein ABZ865_08820 [Streptomyces sp. NPDC047085]|uniref:hypothetical protein n=1 Tax=Streptomyces sp. NPDC047085 TaxID=3155140 RepID=UPI0033F69D27